MAPASRPLSQFKLEDFKRSLHPLLLKLVSGNTAVDQGWGSTESFNPYAALASHLEPEVAVMDPALALERTLRRVAAVLETTTIRVTDQESLSFGSVSDRLFGFEPVVVRDSGKRYDQLIADIRDELHIKHWTTEIRNTLTSNLRNLIAKQCFELYVSVQKPRSYGVVELDRATLLDGAQGVLDSRGVVGIYGESGNGKTVLANRLLIRAAQRSASAVTLRGSMVDDKSFFSHDLHAAIADFGFVNSSWAFEANLLQFRKLMQSQALTAVLLDDVDEETATFLLKDRRVPVVLTSQRRLTSVGAAAYRVGELERRESIDLVSANSATLAAAPTTAAHLSAQLGDRPLPLVLAARIVERGIVTVEDLLSALEVDVVETLDSIEVLAREGVNRPTISVYKALVDYCLASPRLTRLLDVLVWMTGSALRTTFDAFALGGNSALTTIQLEAALTELSDLAVVFVGGEREIECNTLTLTILRELLIERAQTGLGDLYAQAMARGVSRARALMSDEEVRVAPGAQENPLIRFMNDQAFEQEFARLLIRPASQFGVFTISKGTSLLWQAGERGFGLPIVSSPGRAFGLAVIGDNGIIIWGRHGSHVAREEHFLNVYLEAMRSRDLLQDLVRWSNGPMGVLAIDITERRYCDDSSEALQRFTGGEIGTEPPPVPGTMRTLMRTLGPTELASPLKHRMLSGMPPSLLWKVSPLTWTLCGLLIQPQWQGDGSTDVNCPVCLHDASDPRRRQFVRQGLESMLSQVDAETDWSILAALHDIGTGLVERLWFDHAEAGLTLVANMSADGAAEEPIGLLEAYAVTFAIQAHFYYAVDLDETLKDSGLATAEALWGRASQWSRGIITSYEWEYWYSIAIHFYVMKRLDPALEALNRSEKRFVVAFDGAKRPPYAARRRQWGSELR